MEKKQCVYLCQCNVISYCNSARVFKLGSGDTRGPQEGARKTTKIDFILVQFLIVKHTFYVKVKYTTYLWNTYHILVSCFWRQQNYEIVNVLFYCQLYFFFFYNKITVINPNVPIVFFFFIKKYKMIILSSMRHSLRT